MRVLIDAHMVGERETGNETYTVNLIAALQRLEADDLWVATPRPEAVTECLHVGRRTTLLRLSSSSWQRLGWELAALAARYRVDVVHTTYAGPLFCSRPVVTTIHDVSFRSHPEWFSLRDRLVLELGVRLSARRARQIITVSHFSKAEILRFYPQAAGRLSVTHEAAAPGFTPASRQTEEADRAQLARLGVTRPYVLAVGNLQPRKNLPRLLEAFRLLILAQADRNARLVIAGQNAHRAAEVYATMAALQLNAKVRFVGYVSEPALVALYRGAELYCHPASYEGFGLPVLEAMACGTPVVAANTSSIPEIAGDAARLVNPFDPHAIMLAIAELLADPSRREELRRRGLERAASFSWDQTAAATHAVYERCR